jgi:hypothetical protein
MLRAVAVNHRQTPSFILNIKTGYLRMLRSFWLSLLLLPGSLQADEVVDSNRLFVYAEENFAHYFSPAGRETMTLQGYLVRYYPQTNTYLGTRDGKVYVHGEQFGVGILEVGRISDFITVSTEADQDAPSMIDLTDMILTRRSGNCAEYGGQFNSNVSDVSRSLSFTGNFSISIGNGSCVFTSNGIPNHDMGEGGAFATPVSAVTQEYKVPANPALAAQTTVLSLDYDNAILLNGVKVDIFAAACYGVGDGRIGCNNISQPWRYDPMSPLNNFGTDNHNAHTQPNGTYHYHGNPKALFDFSTAVESPVIGFAADGFPIFGSYFNDNGTVRKAESSYRLRSGTRPAGPGNPEGLYDGTYRDDYEYEPGIGDLDACNGMTVAGVYGYYITDAFPWIINCFSGTPDNSFRKGQP